MPLDLLLSGTPIDAARALELGLVDEIVGADVIEGGVEYARRLLAMGAGPRPTASRPGPRCPLDEPTLAGALERHARALRGRTTQKSVFEALRAASELPFSEGLKVEARLSAESLESAESRALRHVFFAERACSRIPGIDTSSGAAAELRRVAVIGAGTMGSGISMALADAGIPFR
jgi:3-hydroxyacyl-CoA dehydrogenase